MCCAFAACGSEDESPDPGDAGTADVSGDTPADVDIEDAVVADTELSDSGLADGAIEDAPAARFDCGPGLTCAAGEICVIECLCCGVDTGNPADQRSDYRCVAPDPACDDEAMACVEAAVGCYANGERECMSPCA